MKGNAEVIDAFNEALSEELTAISQYFLHAEMCENWGYHKLAEAIKKESLDEMRHAEKVIERMLFLEGSPNMGKLQKLNIGQTVPEMLKNDLKLESNAVAMYNRLVLLARKAEDHGSAEIFKDILEDEEGHVDMLETQLSLVKELGLQNYLTLQSKGGE